MNIETYYQRSLKEMGLVPNGIDARHIEAYALLQFGTLSHLDWPTVRREAKIAVECIREDVSQAERLAQSFGL